jgi:hypothetical protein
LATLPLGGRGSSCCLLSGEATPFDMSEGSTRSQGSSSCVQRRGAEGWGERERTASQEKQAIPQILQALRQFDCQNTSDPL